MTDEEGLNISTGGVDETSFGGIIFSNPPGGDNTENLRKKLEFQQSEVYKKSEEFVEHLKENEYEISTYIDKFRYEANEKGKMQLYFIKSNGTWVELIDTRTGGFRKVSAIIDKLGKGGVSDLKLRDIRREKLAKIINDPQALEKEIIEMQEINQKRISDTESLASEKTEEVKN